MNSIINYSCQMAFCLLIFYAFYFIFLRKETCFQYNRAYLLFSSVLAMLLPLLDFHSLFGLSLWKQSGIIPTIYLPEITFPSESSSIESGGMEVNLPGILGGIYFTGMIFFLGRFLIQVATIKGIIARNKFNIRYWKGCYLINTEGKLPTFSFFRYLFWDNSIEFTDREKSQILNHELVHITQKHSFDVLYFEILGVLFWFNPLIVLYKKTVIDTHEFIADDLVIKTIDGSHYGRLIVKQLFKRIDLPMGSYFNKSQAYRRINMIKMSGKKTSVYKMLIVLPLTVTLSLIMGFSVSRGTTSALVYENLSPALLENFRGITPQGTTDLESAIGQIPQPVNQAKIPKGLEYMSGKGSDLQNSKSPASQMPIESVLPEAEEVFTMVEHLPAPEKGMKSFYSYVRKKLKYPADARRKGIEGKVFVQFVVAKDGSLIDVRVLKGIGDSCDEEARKVVQNAEKWTPGKQGGVPVNVRMVIPITFSLG